MVDETEEQKDKVEETKKTEETEQVEEKAAAEEIVATEEKAAAEEIVATEEKAAAEETVAAEETEKVEEKAATEEKEKPLDKMTAIELREVAREFPGVAGVHAMKKDELLKLIKEHRGIKDEEPAKAKKKKGPKKEVNIKKLKEKILQLKEGKKAARAEKDKKKVDIFRRRINRLKKQTRKTAHA